MYVLVRAWMIFMPIGCQWWSCSAQSWEFTRVISVHFNLAAYNFVAIRKKQVSNRAFSGSGDVCRIQNTPLHELNNVATNFVTKLACDIACQKHSVAYFCGCSQIVCSTDAHQHESLSCHVVTFDAVIIAWQLQLIDRMKVSASGFVAALKGRARRRWMQSCNKKIIDSPQHVQAFSSVSRRTDWTFLCWNPAFISTYPNPSR